MDEYDKKFAEMQKYIPFLEAMIERLQNVKDKSSECQLQRLQGLYGVLKNKKRKLKIETLHRCEDVLQKLHNKVEKGNAPGLHLPTKKSDLQSSSSIEDQSSKNHKKATPKPQKVIEIVLDSSADETPASPSPPGSPSANRQTLPIIIPTERSDEGKIDSKPSSPDAAETIPTKPPIVIPTERENVLDQLPDSEENTFSEWDMLEESERRNPKKSFPVSNVPPAAKVIDISSPQKANEGRPIPAIVTRNVHTTVPVLSTLSGPRRLSTHMEKSKLTELDVEIPNSATKPQESSLTNVPEDSPKSPKQDNYFSGSNVVPTPATKDPVFPTKAVKPCLRTPAPLLLSSPPTSSEPPLSMEDIAELLNEDTAEERSRKVKEDNAELKEASREKTNISTCKRSTLPFGKDVSKTEVANQARKSINFFQSESDKRWEEVDKHIVKFLPRKPLPDVKSSGSGISTFPVSSSHLPSGEKLGDHRNRPPSPPAKNEPRYADNYERHPRQHREGPMPDNVKLGPTRRPPEEDVIGAIQPNTVTHHDDRSAPLYQRRPQSAVDNVAFASRQNASNKNWQPSIATPNSNDFCNPQWGSNNFNAMPNVPPSQVPPNSFNQYPLKVHADMWNVPQVLNSMAVNEPQIRPPFPNTAMGTGVRPLLNPPVICPPDRSHVPRDIMQNEVPSGNVTTTQPLLPVGTFPGVPHNRGYDGASSSFERPADFGHNRQSWDNPSARLGDPTSCGGVVVDGGGATSAQFVRTGTPCPWNRERNRTNEMFQNQNRPRDIMYYDRGRGDMRGTFNRPDNRRCDWSQTTYSDNGPRFPRDVRSISERDPRMRADHNTLSVNSSCPSIANVGNSCQSKINNTSPNSSKSSNTGVGSVRDPRLSKDKQHHSASVKSKDTVSSDRDPRRRFSPPPKKTQREKSKSRRSPETHKRDSETSSRQADGKIPRDMMQQSPLESLYGVIDTKAGQSYSLQKFKIPKIKRPERVQSPSTNHSSEETTEQRAEAGSVSPSSGKREVKAQEKKDKVTRPKEKAAEKDETPAEVTSSSDKECSQNTEGQEKSEAEGNLAKETEDSKHIKVGEADSVTNVSAETSVKSITESNVTQELIEALIKKSLECGEGKKLLLEKLREALQAKKFKKIQKIFDSETDSSSDASDEMEVIGQKKSKVRKKRRVIVSDSSEDECLADRLGILQEATTDEKEEAVAPAISTDEAQPKGNNAEESRVASANNSPTHVQSDQDKPEETTVETASETVTEPTKADEDKNLSAEIEPNVTTEKASKARPKRRNSFELLQENIRDMFICEDVITATGYRSCRIPKENQQLNQMPVTRSLSESSTKKADRFSASDKLSEENSESDEPISSKGKSKSNNSNSRSGGKLDKGQGKSKTKKITRVRSKQFVQSSDSEEDQPLALRTQQILDRSNTSNADKAQKDNESDTLRRSKRFFKKDTLKEPRIVIEKTDISKLDSSKIMFDSSSDESFGIDVSELAAAVDISLHPEKQSDQGSPDKKPKSKGRNTKTSKGKGESCEADEKTTEEKTDDRAFSGSDEESITSDTSLSSSIASGKPTSLSSMKSHIPTNEELLSNILVGLVPRKEQTKIAGDKQNDVDNDDHETLSIDLATKKSSTKKKKKRCNWQMGIFLPKKKKKKNSPRTSSDRTSDKSTENSSVEEKISKGDDKDKQLECLDTSREENEKGEDETKISDTVNDEEIKTVEEEERLSKLAAPLPDGVSNEDEGSNGTQINLQQTDKLSKKTPEAKQQNEMMNIDREDLVNYAWAGQDRYKCLLCFFVGKNIVHHYKLNHPDKEVLISRLKRASGKAAVEDAKKNDYEQTSCVITEEENPEYRCRFCCSSDKDESYNNTLESFYEHCTLHTGEYRFRCNSCPYQSAAKSSMKTHYYKSCWKLKGNCKEAIFEDPVPKENSVFGYLCSICNFVQLKRNNVEKHIAWCHSDGPVEIIKINMSIGVKSDEKTISEPTNEAVSSTQFNEIEKQDNEKVDVNIDKKSDEDTDKKLNEKAKEKIDDKTEGTKDTANISKSMKCESIDNATKSGTELSPTDEEKLKCSEEETSEGIQSTGNLSAFVCPPELENKDAEIVLERKKKMQEIIENMKLRKDVCEKGSSIIDRLRNKMETVESVDDCPQASTISKDSAPTIASTDLLQDVKFCISNVCSLSPNFSKLSETDASAPSEEKLQDPSDQEPVESKMKDPLIIMDIEIKKKSDSEFENSDNEHTLMETAAIYESDSSSEQSEHEATDVTTILKETSNINVKDPMLTTIQRLAAQLQGSAPLNRASPDLSESSMTKIKSEPVSPPKIIPKPPGVVPISLAKRIREKQKKRDSSQDTPADEDHNSAKIPIRLRRLSGDMLSSPVTTEENEQDTTKTSTTLDTSQTDNENECSFLKIENVVSLAPNTDGNEAESPIVNDIRKAVEISPIKDKGGVSLLKNPPGSAFILQRLNAVAQSPEKLNTGVTASNSKGDGIVIIPAKNLTSTSTTVNSPLTSNTYIPIVPKPVPVSTVQAVPIAKPAPSTNVSYKIVKVLRTPAVVKQVENTADQIEIKTKSAKAYAEMLEPTKLAHLYKCMSRDCSFSTDTVGLFSRHYFNHACLEQHQTNSSQDYQKCAYCCRTFDEWSRMKLHIDAEHAHCRYQCNYCFYRAITPFFVQLHQASSHPGVRPTALTGKYARPLPLKENINRREYVFPYVCYHDCHQVFYVPEDFAAHLKILHNGLQLQNLKCHLCTTVFTNTDLLLKHYKSHGISKYQCLYCLNGTETFDEMQGHLSFVHFNRLPQFLERSFTKQNVKSKDVVEQLTIQKVGWYFKQMNPFETTNDNVQGHTDTNIYEEQSTDPNVPTLGNTLPNSSIADSSLQRSSNSPNHKATPLSSAHLVNGALLLPENTANKLTVLVTTGMSDTQNIEQQKDTGKEALVKESDLSVSDCGKEDEKKLVNPAEYPNSLDSTDEFINVNVLDNPEFLKNVNIGKVESPKMDEKADDSDVEILESIVSTRKVGRKAESILRTKSLDESANKIEPFRLKDEEKEQLFVCSSTENSCTSFDMSNNDTSCENAVKTQMPLTLEDIKDTGFAGTMLYKCGYESCTFEGTNSVVLKSHMKECNSGGEGKHSYCVHCKKRFLKIGFLLEHLKIHGLKRFGCSLCKLRYVTGFQATTHMKAKHKYSNSKLIPADPKNPSADGLFVVQPISGLGDRKGKKRKGGKSTEKDVEKKDDMEKLSFGPSEIEQLPRQAIYNRQVQCAICPYTTKVRTNIVRHLQLHAKDETVPESGPVNPVPCLDKKERMFDKMVNLASSSHQNGRMGGKQKEVVKDNDDESIPKFVPENKRYVCGVVECNYLTVDEAMLRYHLKALHSEEPYFKCPHCPQPAPGQEAQNIAIEKMGVHLKMHDARLYKCSHCNHHHYHRHVVERHLSDKHPEKRPYVKVVRELENADGVQPSAQEETEEDHPDADGNHWKCNICDYKCVYKTEMATHAANIHQEKSQYRCTLCAFKTSGKMLLEQHITSKHSSETNADYVVVYQKIKGLNKKNGDGTEQGIPDEQFDTTPLWRRDMPRIRHIRGILLEEEDVRKASESKGTKRKSDTEITGAKPAKIKAGKSASLEDNKQYKGKSKRSLSCEKISESDNGAKSAGRSDVIGTSKTLDNINDPDITISNESEVGRFGPYGKPIANMYVCTLCSEYKSKSDNDMRNHLYKELKYARWHCKECGYLTVNHKSLLNHFKKSHNGIKVEHQALSPDSAIEEWVSNLLGKQASLMKEPVQDEDSLTGKPEVSGTVKNVKRTIVQSIKNLGKSPKAVDLAQTISTLQDEKGSDFNVSLLSDDDDEDLIIDMKDDDVTEVQSIVDDPPKKIKPLPKEEKSDAVEKPFVCKHCGQKFPRWRGLKLHVQVSHLKRLGYLCPYCDRSSNSETLLRHHIQAKHPGCEEKVIDNPDSRGPELSREFWEKEYGIIIPKRTKKRKRQSSLEDVTASEKDSREQTETQEICTICGFTAMNLAGLKVHMRRHTCKNYLKCKHCTFSGSVKAELHEHWQINHAHLPFNIEDTSTSGSAKQVLQPQQAQQLQPSKKRSVTDYIDDIEEEPIPLNGPLQDTLIYCCFYCHTRMNSLYLLKNHWNENHKDMAFRYKEYKVSLGSPETVTKKGQCSVEGAESAIKAYMKHSQNSGASVNAAVDIEKDGWICQWCEEFCDSEVNKKAHHDLFHSHKPMNFKRQGKEEIPEEYVCPECSLITQTVAAMKKHLGSHINIFQCRHCEKGFSEPDMVASHNLLAHPGLEVKIDSIRDYEVSIERLMTKVMFRASNGDLKLFGGTKKTTEEEVPKRVAMAKKSTTKSIMYRARPNSKKIQAVARKSTNPLPRYPPGINFNRNISENDGAGEEIRSKQFSFYGIPEAPIDLGRLSTYMMVGSHRMRVNCTTLAKLININPRIILHDVRKTSLQHFKSHDKGIAS